MDFLLNLDFWFTVLRSTTPVLFATMAALVASTSGVLNLGLEGCMTISAICGVLGSGFTGSLLVGMLCGLGAGITLTLLLAYCVLNLRANAIITGVALNLAATGGSVFMLYSITGDKNASNSLNSMVFPTVQIPVVQNIPVIGKILSGHNILTYLAILVSVLLFIMLRRTRFGVKLRSVGEMPAAAESVGIQVKKVQYQALLISGLLASLGGMYLSMGYVNRFTSNMIAGRGYIALATNAMAAGNPLMGLLSSTLYGLGNAIAIYTQNRNVDTYLVTLIPYSFIVLFYLTFSFIQKRKNQN